MRVRLLLDCELSDGQIPELAEQIAEQPVVNVQMPDPIGLMGARFMGAQQVMADGQS